MSVCVCVLVSLLILHNLQALPLFLLLARLLLLLLTVDEEPPQLEQQQQQKQPQKVGEKSAHLLCKATALGAARRREDRGGRVPRWLPGLRLLKLAASQFLPKSSGKKLMDCYLVVSLAHHPLLPLPRPLCVQLKRGIFVSHIREGNEWGKRERGEHLCFVCS